MDYTRNIVLMNKKDINIKQTKNIKTHKKRKAMEKLKRKKKIEKKRKEKCERCSTLISSQTLPLLIENYNRSTLLTSKEKYEGILHLGPVPNPANLEWQSQLFNSPNFLHSTFSPTCFPCGMFLSSKVVIELVSLIYDGSLVLHFFEKSVEIKVWVPNYDIDDKTARRGWRRYKIEKLKT